MTAQKMYEKEMNSAHSYIEFSRLVKTMFTDELSELLKRLSSATQDRRWYHEPGFSGVIVEKLKITKAELELRNAF
jgi:hypothetical protein